MGGKKIRKDLLINSLLIFSGILLLSLTFSSKSNSSQKFLKKFEKINTTYLVYIKNIPTGKLHFLGKYDLSGTSIIKINGNFRLKYKKISYNLHLGGKFISKKSKIKGWCNIKWEKTLLCKLLLRKFPTTYLLKAYVYKNKKLINTFNIPISYNSKETSQLLKTLQNIASKRPITLIPQIQLIPSKPYIKLKEFSLDNYTKLFEKYFSVLNNRFFSSSFREGK